MMDAGHTTNTDPLILRIARVDELSDPFVLVKVTHSGSDELDITLLATDGMSPFALSREPYTLASRTSWLRRCSEGKVGLTVSGQEFQGHIGRMADDSALASFGTSSGQE